MLKAIIILLGAIVLFFAVRGLTADFSVDPNIPKDTTKDAEQTEEPEFVATEWAPNSVKSGGVEFNLPVDWQKETVLGPGALAIIKKDNNLIGVRLIGPLACACAEEELARAIVDDAVYSATGEKTKDISEFQKVQIGKQILYRIRTARGRGILSYSYYLFNKNQIYVFYFSSRGYDWSNTALDDEKDEVHMTLKQMLSLARTY